MPCVCPVCLVFGGVVLSAPLCPQFRVPGPSPGPARAARARGAPRAPHCCWQGWRCCAGRVLQHPNHSELLQLLLCPADFPGKMDPTSCPCWWCPSREWPLCPSVAHSAPGPSIAPLSPTPSPAASPALGVTRFSQGGQRLAGQAEPLGLGHRSAVGHAQHQWDACLGIARLMICPCASLEPLTPQSLVSPLWLQVTRMLWYGKPWRSMCKGLVLGTLLTSFMLLLYSYAVPPLQVSVTE